MRGLRLLERSTLSISITVPIAVVVTNTAAVAAAGALAAYPAAVGIVAAISIVIPDGVAFVATLCCGITGAFVQMFFARQVSRPFDKCKFYL